MLRRSGRRISPWRLVLALGGLAAGTASAAPGEEPALWKLWQQHAQEPDNHPAAFEAAQAFEKQFPKSPLLGVTRGLVAWHALKAGRPAEAAKVLESMAGEGEGADPLAKAAREMALRWLTRLDREQWPPVLKAYYADHVEFPAKLDGFAALPEAKRPPMSDRWGKPWVYRIAPLIRLRTNLGQTFVLQSSVLGETTELAKALKLPYAAGIDLRPVRLVSGAAGTAVLFEAGTEKPLLTVGTAQGRVTFAWMGAETIVLSNGDHWQLLRRPPP